MRCRTTLRSIARSLDLDYHFVLAGQTVERLSGPVHAARAAVGAAHDPVRARGPRRVTSRFAVPSTHHFLRRQQDSSFNPN
jgi:hypothetical protein